MDEQSMQNPRRLSFESLQEHAYCLNLLADLAGEGRQASIAA
ncbi:hypothetical protein [Teichococcus rhizosphaerae]|nr:hypothetical protein [Pseudoroseomonas rhizosphaerae]